MNLHYLSPEEEQAIKSTVPWDSCDHRVLELVRVANKISGLATVQSCAGHVSSTDDGFHVRNAHLVFRATKSRTYQILFDLAPSVGIPDIELRYWEDGTFWIKLVVHPTERFRFYELIEALNQEGE